MIKLWLKNQINKWLISYWRAAVQYNEARLFVNRICSVISPADIRIESDLKFGSANYTYFEIPYWHQLSTTVLYFKLHNFCLVFQTCICSCCCCTFIKVWRYCGLFSALLLLLNTLRGLKKRFKFWFKFVVASRKIRLEKLDNTETNHPRNAFNGWFRHLLLKIMKKSISSSFLKMVGI